MRSTDTVIAFASKPAKHRAFVYISTALLIGAIIVAAAFQDQLNIFFRLKLWDKDAAGRTVTRFLDAGKRGDRDAATRLLGASSYKPVVENGKFVGYSMTSMAGNQKFLFSDLVGDQEPMVTGTVFMHSYAKVSVPGANGKPVTYRLEMIDGNWKITQILSGGLSR